MRAPSVTRSLVLASAVAMVVVATAAGCTEQQPALEPAASPTSTTTSAAASVSPAPALPEGPLRELVPAPGEVPEGLEPVVAGSGPRDAAAVAAFSADPAAASDALARNGFQSAYVVQYASRTDVRSLTVVAVRFAAEDGARADLDGDVAQTGGTEVEAPTIGDASDVRRLDLPGDDAAELVTVRFRAGTTTWLVAWRAVRPADAEEPLAVARSLAERA